MSLAALEASLAAAGWLPDWPNDRWREFAGYSDSLAGRDNLLEVLAEFWEAAAPRSQRRFHHRLARWARTQLSHGAFLGHDVPDFRGTGHPSPGWLLLPRCLQFWPQPPQDHPWIAIVSSRRGRRVDCQRPWVDAVRAACVAAQRSGAAWLLAEQTATGSIAAAASQLFGLHSLRVRTPGPRDIPGRWLRRLVTLSRCTRLSTGGVWLSPPLLENRPAENLECDRTTPLRDEAIVAWADRLYVVHVRVGGAIERLVRLRMATPAASGTGVFLARDPGLIPPALFAEFSALGAEGFDLSGGVLEAAAVTGSAFTGGGPGYGAIPAYAETNPSGGGLELKSWGARRAHLSPSSEILTAMPQGSELYLSHCTRSASGPWPDQSLAEYQSELLLTAYPPQRGPLESLLRIIAQRRLVATGRGIRGGWKVVSFTEAPWEELAALRVFRPHRGRWDFEPYGISIRRTWLEERGARPVIYGDDDVWASLGPELRPYFQKRFSTGRRRSRGWDWAVEREWRQLGDVGLHLLPHDAALLFAPDLQSARVLASSSPWPVFVLPQHDQGRRRG
jgi:hypothetical protein